MKTTYIFLLSVYLVACDNNINGSNEVKADLPTVTAPILPVTDTAKKDIIKQPTVTLPSASTTNPTTSTNPPHGQPGHICGPTGGAPISVGPSASSPSVATSTAPVTAPPVQKSSTAQPPSLQLGSANAKAGVRLNPAHGQPGHDCNIEVGKPLKQ